ncbi:MAG: hypothetical protein RLZZ612_892 [Pseudomonadota bacterium]|jgi:hypothetical protein
MSHALRNFWWADGTQPQRHTTHRFAGNDVVPVVPDLDLQRRLYRSDAVAAAILGRFFSSSLPPWFALGRFAGLFSACGGVVDVR